MGVDLDQLYATESERFALQYVTPGSGIAKMMTAAVIFDRKTGLTERVDHKKIHPLGVECKRDADPLLPLLI